VSQLPRLRVARGCLGPVWLPARHQRHGAV